MSVALFLIGFASGAVAIAIGYLIGYQHGFDTAMRDINQ